MANYMICDGNGNAITMGLQEHNARRIAQEIADDRGESVWLSLEGDEGGEEEEFEPESDQADAEGTDVPCECGEAIGGSCAWTGPVDETVTVEVMPECHRASHTAAGNRGVYPHNGAIRVRCERGCAEAIVDSEAGWAEIVDA